MGYGVGSGKVRRLLRGSAAALDGWIRTFVGGGGGE